MEAATDFTMWALFARATITVKIVMIMLIFASFWCWAVIIDKIRQYRRARREAEIFDMAFGLESHWMRYTIKSAPIPVALPKQFLLQECWNGGVRIATTVN